MPLIKVYNNDSDPYGLKGHSIFKSVRPSISGYAIIPKLHEWYLRHHVRAASAEAVSFRSPTMHVHFLVFAAHRAVGVSDCFLGVKILTIHLLTCITI
jgi:hypothetical protein